MDASKALSLQLEKEALRPRQKCEPNTSELSRLRTSVSGTCLQDVRQLDPKGHHAGRGRFARNTGVQEGKGEFRTWQLPHAGDSQSVPWRSVCPPER